jgi:hypothetical protein
LTSRPPHDCGAAASPSAGTRVQRCSLTLTSPLAGAGSVSLPSLSLSLSAGGAGTMGSYNATVLMKASECDSTTTMASLKGKNACSTGYGKTAGWQTPIGLMLDNGVMPIVSHPSFVHPRMRTRVPWQRGRRLHINSDGLHLRGESGDKRVPGVCRACAGRACSDVKVANRTNQGLDTGRESMALERWTAPRRSRRTCSPRCGPQSWGDKISAGVAKRRRELVLPRFATWSSCAGRVCRAARRPRGRPLAPSSSCLSPAVFGVATRCR